MKSIFLSKKAAQKLNTLLEYLETNWPKKVKKEFIEKLDKSILQIQNFPSSAQSSEIEKGLFRIVITKQTTLYYKVTAKGITIVTLFDTRMNPDKINKEI
jgi:plasmid stabilization system protein ParE